MSLSLPFCELYRRKILNHELPDLKRQSVVFNTSFITYMRFPGGSAGKESTCKAGDLGSIPGLGRSPGEGKGNPLQYSGLENSMDCIVGGVAKSRTRLSDFHFHLLKPLRLH